MNKLEQELKISLTQEEYETLLSVSAARPQLQTNFYFACADMPVDTLVRVRVKDGEYIFCYKKLLNNANGVNLCDERECKIDKSAANDLITNGLTVKQFKSFVGSDADIYQTLFCFGNLKTYRAKFELGEWTIELDKNEYLGVTDFELECECDDLASLEKLKKYLDAEFGVTFKPSIAKSASFFARYGKDVKQAE